MTRSPESRSWEQCAQDEFAIMIRKALSRAYRSGTLIM